MHRLAPCLVTVLFVVGVVGCLGGRDELPDDPRRPVIVIGIDGADWGVIRTLWKRGELPTLRRLGRKGWAGPLATAYGESPVIWTTIATGRTPQAHGITGFVVPGPEGDVPVSSSVRRVPALWNMASRVGLRPAVVGWWASWPAEEIHGVVVSDRALSDPDRGVSPAPFRERFRELEVEALAEPSEFGGNPAARDRDRVTAKVAEVLAGEGFDLMLVYFRGVDIASHLFWKYHQPERFPEVDEEELEAHRDEIPKVYRATDRAIGRILAAAPASNVFVVSDHGFHGVREEIRVVLDLDRVLEALDLLRRTGNGGVDRERSVAVTFGSAPAENPKRVALGGAAGPGAVEDVVEALAAVRYSTGSPVLRARAARKGEVGTGSDLVVRVLAEGASTEVVVDDQPIAGAVQEIVGISGSHGPRTEGIFLAWGPDLDPEAAVESIRIHDVAPTVLAALGLPVARDFAGEAKVGLFDRGFRARHPLRRIDSWGEPGRSRVTVSDEDRALLEELRTLGYID